MKKKRSKVLIIILAICAVIVAALVIVGIWQRDNIKALILTATNDSQSLEEKLQKQEQDRQDLLERYDLKDPNTSNDLEDGSGDTSDAPDGEQPEDDDQAPDDADQNAEDGDNAIQQAVNDLYALEGTYMSRISGVVSSVKAEYLALPKEERTSSKKAELVSSGMSQLSALESQCDAAVEAQLAVIKTELQAQGKDDKLVQEIRALYRESKATQKAAFLTELAK